MDKGGDTAGAATLLERYGGELSVFFTPKLYYTFCSDWPAATQFVCRHINVWKAYCFYSSRFLISTAHIQQAACSFVLTNTLIYQATRIKHVKYPRVVIRTVPTSFRADDCALITSHIAGMFEEPHQSGLKLAWTSCSVNQALWSTDVAEYV